MAEEGQVVGSGEELDSGNYEVIRRRLLEHGADLSRRADALNERRKETFGGTELGVIGNSRVRTENNCVPRDIVNVGGHLLFGYNVFIGLRSETKLSEVFSLHDIAPATEGDGFTFDVAPPGTLPGLLGDAELQSHFADLYTYYKDARLALLRVTEGKLLAVFQVGATMQDIRVLRWRLDDHGVPTYLDNRGERDHVFPPSHDFEWTAVSRDNFITTGAHPHISIADEIFVETIGGTLTVKVEDNTAVGKGIYDEPVDDLDQSLDDADISYAKLGALILLRIKPYREQAYRYLVYSDRARTVLRVDSIGKACVQLPEDHGIIFPDGYVLQSGEHKVFDSAQDGLVFKRVVRSPNGEDVLYVFHDRVGGHYLLFPYNLIRKEVANPIHCHGYTLFDDGKMVVFRALSDEPTRVHPMQVWQTPFTSVEYAESAPTDGSYLSKVGNAELVRGISDAYSVVRLVRNAEPSRQVFEDIIAAVTRAIDQYYWLANAEIGDLLTPLKTVRDNGELIIGEFEKVQALKARAATALAEAEEQQVELLKGVRPRDFRSVDKYMAAMTALRTQRGHLITLKETRYIDLARIHALEQETIEQFDTVSQACVQFLLGEDALRPLIGQLGEILAKVEGVAKSHELEPLTRKLDATSAGLSVLSEVVGGLEVDDPTSRTTILEGISEVFSQVNRVRAVLVNRRKEVLSAEGRAEFSAQFKLFGQNVTSSLALAQTPDSCEEQLARLMVQIEELEARFSEFDEFLGDLATKREEVYEAFGSKKQRLIDERQRRASNIASAADRILQGVRRRSQSFETEDELNAYFAADTMIMKLRQLAEQLLALEDSVKADELESRLKTARQDAVRGLRDKVDLFVGGANVVKLGRHHFNINTQPLELTMVPHDGGMALHLTGTNFFEPLRDEAFLQTKPFWDQHLVSETPEVYRGEFLAASLLFAAEEGREGLSIKQLQEAKLTDAGLLSAVRAYSAERYDEGYERGLHDADASLILEALLRLRSTAGLLRFAPTPRAFACFFWALGEDEEARGVHQRKAQSLGRLREAFAHPPALATFQQELALTMGAFLEAHHIGAAAADVTEAGRYLAEELMAPHPTFVTSVEATSLRDALLAQLDRDGSRSAFELDLRTLEENQGERFAIAKAWLDGFLAARREDPAIHALAHVVDEAVVLLLTERQLARAPSAARTSVEVDGLLGQHPQIRGRVLPLRLDEFIGRLRAFMDERVPGYRAYRDQTRRLVERERARLRIDEFMPRVLSSFVRNKLINDVYLPRFGDNLAKQLGAAGADKRTDLMGLLLLISPPGYGKTTLMEYLASRLGLVFMKINGPSLGHSVTSLDPAEAPNATARQEVEKINLSFEMGSNVMLYLDDIQHTHPEFLQKFISLCDGQRRVEGIWNGHTRTYDLRGKKFCVVMAGNPYTESGEKFQVPDMLANRADVYDLGDILDGKDDVFALSYIENSLTSSPTLAPMAGRSQADIYRLIAMAQGEQIPTTELDHSYSAVELSEILTVLQRMFRVQQVLLAVNQAYIASASMDDAFRTEPRFQLQGSYRNMNKLAEKVVAAMNDQELEALIADHYLGEARTLTTGSEANLLKLAELRGVLSADQEARWEEIKKAFRRVLQMGGKEDDPITRVTGTLVAIGAQIEGVQAALSEAAQQAAARAASSDDDDASAAPLLAALGSLQQAFARVARPQLEVKVTAEPPPGLDRALQQQVELVRQTLLPLSQVTARNLEEGQRLAARLTALAEQVREAYANWRPAPTAYKRSTQDTQELPAIPGPAPTPTRPAPAPPRPKPRVSPTLRPKPPGKGQGGGQR